MNDNNINEYYNVRIDNFVDQQLAQHREMLIQQRERIIQRRRTQEETQQNLLLRRQIKQENGINMCSAIKRNGFQCSFKARNGHNVCGKHMM